MDDGGMEYWWLYGALNKEEWWIAMICSNEWLYNRLHFCVVMSSNDICKDYWGSHLSITDKQRRRKLCLNFAFAWNIEKEWDTQQSTIEGKRATTHATKHNYKWCLRNHSLYCYTSPWGWNSNHWKQQQCSISITKMDDDMQATCFKRGQTRLKMWREVLHNASCSRARRKRHSNNKGSQSSRDNTLWTTKSCENGVRCLMTSHSGFAKKNSQGRHGEYNDFWNNERRIALSKGKTRVNGMINWVVSSMEIHS